MRRRAGAVIKYCQWCVIVRHYLSRPQYSADFGNEGKAFMIFFEKEKLILCLAGTESLPLVLVNTHTYGQRPSAG